MKLSYSMMREELDSLMSSAASEPIVIPVDKGGGKSTYLHSECIIVGASLQKDESSTQ